MAQIHDPRVIAARILTQETIKRALLEIHELVSCRIALPANALPPFEWIHTWRLDLGPMYVRSRWTPPSGDQPGRLRWELLAEGRYPPLHVHEFSVDLIDTEGGTP